jgi:hypothetical protein
MSNASWIMGRRRPCAFTETDVTRLLKAAKKAAVDVCIRLDAERKTMTITTIVKGDTTTEADDLDRELKEFEARHAN